MNRSVAMSLACCFAVFLIVSCGRKHGDSDTAGDVLARVGESVLTLNDVTSLIPAGLSADDSIRFVRGYARNWIDNKLVGEVAVKNIPDSKSIDRMVEEYRIELIMWEYRKRMFDQHAPSFLNDDSLKSYYEVHSGEWLSETPLLKGIYVRVADSDPRLNDIRKRYRSSKTSDLETLEKYALSETVDYDYFRERWTDWETLAARMPVDKDFLPDAYWSRHKSLEISKNGQVYMLSVLEYLPVKSPMPYEVAVEAVKDRLANERRVQFDRELKDELLADGLNSGDVELHIDLD